MIRAGAVLTIALTLAYLAEAKPLKAPPRPLPEGRFLYADDDDWDWASPANAKQPSGMSVYGRMPWSALDWMEDGLDEVRGVLIGTPPASGGYLTMGDLNRVRNAGPKRAYEQITHTPNVLSGLVKDKKPPNVIIMMQDVGGRAGPTITEQDVDAAVEFVKGGGRLMLLDDWRYYRTLATPFADKRRFEKKTPPVVDPALRKAVEAQVKLLESTEFKVREKASADLLKIGKAIVPILEDIQPTSLEQQRRIEVILRALRPPAPHIANDDAWLSEVVKSARAIHRAAEVKTILRNAKQLPGTALCIDFSHGADKGK